jgi:hypothetical protein
MSGPLSELGGGEATGIGGEMSSLQVFSLLVNTSSFFFSPGWKILMCVDCAERNGKLNFE